jgi:hypothetical protein
MKVMHEVLETSVDSRRLLVVANEACAGDALFAEIRNRTGEGAEVLVLAPALTPRLQFWLNDEALGRQAAEDLLSRSFAACEHEGLKVHGEVGDPDPLQAIDDAIRTFDPDAIVIVTHPVGKQNWLERDVVAQARGRYALPITHLVVEPEAARAVVVPAGPDEGRAVERHAGRDVTVLLLALGLAFVGSLGWGFALARDWSDRMSMAWFYVLDLGLKAVAVVILWRLFMRRGRADRLDL